MTRSAHRCPCGCESWIPHEKLACRDGWFRLPAPLRDAINRGWRSRRQDPRMHSLALRAALDWYRRNQQEAHQ